MTGPQFDIPGYQLLRELGAGGMATVFLCLQTSLDRKVAIKVMRRGDASGLAEARFLMEGRAMARLPHRNIVGVHDIVQTPEINYIAMEYLPGGTLAEHLRDGVSLADAIGTVVQIADALQLAHDNGIVHRDLKPANIIFRDASTPVLTDFGIARLDDGAGNRLTLTGMTVGTPTYMSPEQASDQPCDGRSDQYSLGVLFYEMLTGAPPFQGSTPVSVALAHVGKPPPPLPEEFARFQGVLDRMLAKDPEDRFPDLRTFVRALKSLVTGDAELMTMLRTAPNESTSGQLRALGFATSQRVGSPRPGPVTGPAGATMVMPGASSPGFPRGPVSGPTMAVPSAGAPAGPPRRRLAIIVGAIATVLLALSLGWYLIGRDAPLDPKIRALVADTLSASDRLMIEGKLVSPPGDNAYEKIQTVLQVAPGLPEATERIDRIALALREQASAELSAGRFDTAQARVDEALAVKPEDINLLALSRQITSTRQDVERNTRIANLLKQADEAEQAGRIAGEGTDNALALVRAARELDTRNAAVGERLSAIVDKALAPARDALAAGALDDADASLDALSGLLATEPAWQALGQDIRQVRDRALQAERLGELTDNAKVQIEAGRLAEPAGDNALETLARLRDIAPDDPVAAELATDIAVRLARLAADAEKAERYSDALSLYDQALQAVPGTQAYLDSKSALEQRLGARQTEINRELIGAREAIAERRFLQPADDNARQRIDAVLALDPGNAEATRLRADLPRLIRDAIRSQIAEGELDDAGTLLSAARKQFASDTTVLAAFAAVDSELQGARSAATRARSLLAIREQLAKPRLEAADAGRTAKALAALLAENPQDRDALAYRNSLYRRVSTLVGAAATGEALAAIEPVVTEIRRGLPDDAGSKTLVTTLASRRSAVVDKERAELAAISGELVLNATPWAEVVSVVDLRNNSRVALPSTTATPMRLTLREGTYRVTLKHPAARESRVLVANVVAKKVVQQSAAFPTLDADDFLDRAGFEP